MTWPWSPRCRCLILTSTGELSEDMAVKPTMSLSISYLHWRAVWGHGREAHNVAVYFLPPLASCLRTWPWSPRCRCLFLTSTGELSEDMAVKPTMSLSISYLHWRAVWGHGREAHDVAVYFLPPLASWLRTWPWSPRCRCLFLTSTGELSDDMAVKPTMSLSNSYLHWRAVWGHGREAHDVAVYFLPPLASCLMTWPWSRRCRCLIRTSTGELSDDMAVKPTMSLSISYLHWRAVWWHGREAHDVAV